jgi:hypothetical protein
MSLPRIRIVWILVAALLVAVGFFGYHIFDAMNQPVNHLEPDVPKPANEVPRLNVPVVKPKEELFLHSEPIMHEPEPLPMPHVVGQTEEDLRETVPVNDTPPPIQYSEPESSDPLEGVVNSESEFGDNLRHPEQMIEMMPPMGSLRSPQSGLDSDVSTPGRHDPTMFAPEMAQNGGEFMRGIVAFDGDDGIGYSMI